MSVDERPSGEVPLLVAPGMRTKPIAAPRSSWKVLARTNRRKYMDFQELPGAACNFWLGITLKRHAVLDQCGTVKDTGMTLDIHQNLCLKYCCTSTLAGLSESKAHH